MAKQPLKSKRIDERISWSFLGVLLAIAFGSFGLYTWLHTKQPDITYEIEAETDVVDLHTPLQDLTIFFRGEDIRAQNLNLRVLTIRISNKGDLDLLQTQYDQTDPWGFKVTPGRIVDVRIASSNSKYLQSHLKPRIDGTDRILLDKSIFERQKWVVLDLLVIHGKSEPPELVPFGKIAGAETIPVLKPYLTKDRETLWTKVISGAVLIHVLRFALYIGIFILWGLIVVLSSVGVASLIDSLRIKRRRTKAARLSPPAEERAKWDVLVGIYVEGGVVSVKRLRQDLRDVGKLAKIVALHHQAMEARRRRNAAANVSGWNDTELDIAIGMPHRHVSPAIGRLIAAKLIGLSEDGGAAWIDPSVHPLLDELLPDLLEIN